MKLLLTCWWHFAGYLLPPMAVVFLMNLLDEGFSGGDLGGMLVGWGGVSLCAAVLAVVLLRRRARGAGIVLTVGALADRQIRLLRARDPGDGWQTRVRDRLAAGERASLVAEKGREEIWFRWRPGRSDRSVWGSLAFDADAGTVVLDLRDGERLLGVAGLRRGAAFTALCQVAVALELTGDP
ncbi:hypothetical protein ACIPSE_01975 [Streptomyces sp. NPDC090106]|uniref:hypothetical protein n=1 Tax=Streptomyces sp. NPDC090106 TaxID=3365946 RepID=UPI0037F3FAEE